MNSDQNRIAALENELEILRKSHWYSIAKLEALESFVVAEAARVNGQPAETVFLGLQGEIRRAYDRLISDLETRNPGYAAKIDVRATMGEKENLRWYFPDDPENQD
jgi:hypothetical protein